MSKCNIYVRKYLYARVLIVRNDIGRMKRKMLGLLVLGVALVPFASSPMAIDPSALVRRVSQSNLAQGKVSGGGGDGIFITGRTYAYVVEGSGTTDAFQIQYIRP